jgi:hypothetical protein
MRVDVDTHVGLVNKHDNIGINIGKKDPNPINMVWTEAIPTFGFGF